MQNSSAPSMVSLALWAVATPVLSGLSALVAHLLTRPKQSADIHKTEAETRQIESSIMMKIYERLDDYETMRQRDSNRIADLENRNFNLECAGRAKDSENRRLQDEMTILNLQVQKAKAKGFLAGDRAPGSPNPAA